MSYESFGSCPHCQRNLDESERYCRFCEQDVSDVRDKEEAIVRKKN